MKSRNLKSLSCVLAVAMLAGCATSGANYVPVVDTGGVDLNRYSADLGQCQQFALQRANAAQGAMAGAIAGALLMGALGGHSRGIQQGAIIGGVSAGAGANETQEVIIKRCLAGRGYNVLN
jgi:outer membrane lipoprotein SlyB